MKKITDLKPQIKNPTRYNCYLDNVFYCGLELETIMKHRLKVGMDVDEEYLESVQLESERLKALDKALNFISRSKKTKKQVEDYLSQKGYAAKTIDEVISSMQGYGFVDDGDYALDYAKSLSSKKGKNLIALELRQKGVSERDMQEALENIGDQTDSASEIAKKYMRNKPADRQNVMKCYKYLLSKGFDYDTAKSAVDKLSGDSDF